MRSRIIAIIILLLFIGGPIFLYWYFYKKNISSIVILSDSNESYTVHLEGNLKYSYFPLLDEVFIYRSNCTGSCIFTPIPPISYKLRIETRAREDIHAVLDLPTGGQLKYTLILPKVLITEKIGMLPYGDTPPSMLNVEFIGMSSDAQPLGIKQFLDGTEVGVIGKNTFTPLFRTQSPVSNPYFDASRLFVIFPESSGKQLIYPINPKIPGTSFLNREKIQMVRYEQGSWKVRTEVDSYENIEGTWVKNMRFTDYIDLNQRYRLGYIDANEEEKLMLQNYAKGKSLIVLLDRNTNESTVLRQGTDIYGFLIYSYKKAYLDLYGNIFSLEIRGSFE